MEKLTTETVLKARSYRSVLSTGLRLYTENFRRLFKASWLWVLIHAIAEGCLGTLVGIKMPEITVGIIQQIVAYQGFSPDAALQYTVTAAEILGLILLTFVTMGMASGTFVNKLKEHKDTGTITMPTHWLSASLRLTGRTLKGMLFTLLLILVPFLLFAAAMAGAEMASSQFILRHTVTLATMLTVYTIIVLCFALPLMFVFMKYVLEAPCGYWQTLAKHYGRGLRHWGALFNVFFLSSLLVAIASFIVGLPAMILNFANQQAHLGQLMGDPLGMPSYIAPLTFGTAMLCNFLGFYIIQTTLIHNYYIYGSIEAKEQEREQQKANIQ